MERSSGAEESSKRLRDSVDGFQGGVMDIPMAAGGQELLVFRSVRENRAVVLHTAEACDGEAQRLIDRGSERCSRSRRCQQTVRRAWLRVTPSRTGMGMALQQGRAGKQHTGLHRERLAGSPMDRGDGLCSLTGIGARRRAFRTLQPLAPGGRSIPGDPSPSTSPDRWPAPGSNQKIIQ